MNDKWTASCKWLVMSEIMRNSRDHVSCTQHLEVTYALKKNKHKSQLFMVSSAVSFHLIFHWLDLLMDFYCRGIGVELEKKFAASIFDCLDWYCDVVMRKNELSDIFYFLYFLYIWIYCNDTQLMQIARNQNLGQKKEKKTFKKYKNAVTPTPATTGGG